MTKAEFNPLEKECLEWLYDKLDEHLDEHFEDVTELVNACFQFEIDSKGMCISTSGAVMWIYRYWTWIGNYVDLYNIENENPISPFNHEEWFMLQIIVIVCSHCINDKYYWQEYTLTTERINKIKNLIDNCKIIAD